MAVFYVTKHLGEKQSKKKSTKQQEQQQKNPKSQYL